MSIIYFLSRTRSVLSTVFEFVGKVLPSRDDFALYRERERKLLLIRPEPISSL